MRKYYERVWNAKEGVLELREHEPPESDADQSLFQDGVELVFAMTYDEYIDYWLPKECTAAEALQIWVALSERTLMEYYKMDPEACLIWWELELETGLIEAPEAY